MSNHVVSFVLYLGSLLFLIVAFYAPFFSIGLDMEVPSSIAYGKELIDRGISTPIIGDTIANMANSFFGPELFGAECQKDWTPCFRDWIATQIGIRRGEQYLLAMIRDMFVYGEIVLATLLFTFSVVFPISKNLLGFWATICSSIKTKQWCYVWLGRTGKWSMTDVFVVALLILFLKAEGLHLQLEAQMGVYMFAASALLSSIATQRLGTELGAHLSFLPVQASASNHDSE